MKRYSVLSLLLSVAVLFLLVPLSNADQINPGDVNVNLSSFNTASLTLVASTGATPVAFTLTSSTGGSLNGTYQSAVYQDALGHLDFLYQVNAVSNGSNGGDFVGQVSMANFAGFVTNVGVVDSTFGIFTASGNTTFVNPTGDDRSADGSTIDFSFAGSHNLLAGQSSGILVVSTLANSYTAGSLNILDDGAAQPAPAGFSPVPEPTSMALLGVGLLGIAGTRRFLM